MSVAILAQAMLAQVRNTLLETVLVPILAAALLRSLAVLRVAYFGVLRNRLVRLRSRKRRLALLGSYNDPTSLSLTVCVVGRV